MKKSVCISTGIIVVMLTLLTGCSFPDIGKEETKALPFKDTEWVVADGSNTPSKYDEVIFFTENPDMPNSGSLYIQKNSNAQEKISDGISKDGYKYLYTRKTVLFLDIENNLYMKEEGIEKVKIASDVFPDSILVSDDESTLAFLCTKSPQVDSQFPADLYRVELGKERDKISSDVSLNNYGFSYSGNVIVFRTNDQNLYVKDSAQNEKEKIASSVISFAISGKGNAVYYQKDTGGMYYKLHEESEPVKVYTGTAGSKQLTYFGDTYCYLADYNKDVENPKGELYLFKPGVEPLKISSDIVQYVLAPDGRYIYYLNIDKALYAMPLPKLINKDEKGVEKFKEVLKAQEKQKLSDDVTDFKISQDGGIIAWTNTDFDLYSFEQSSERRQKLASNVESFNISANAVIYLNKDKELFEAKRSEKSKLFDLSSGVKVCSDTIGYAASPYCKYVSYSTSAGELYYLVVGSQPFMLTDKLNEHDYTYFMNQQLYEKRLQLKDMAGTWKCQTDNGVMQIKDNIMIVFDGNQEHETTFTVQGSYRNKLEIDEGLPEISILELDAKDNLIYSYGEGNSDVFSRISKEEYDKEANRLKNVVEENQAIQENKRKYYSISSCNVYVNILKDGSAMIEEQLTYDLHGQYNGFLRDIDFSGSRGISGQEVLIASPGGQPVKCTPDNSGKPNTYQMVVEGNLAKLKVYMPSLNESRTITYKYRLSDVVTKYNDIAEFNRKIIDSGWDVDIDNVYILISLPAGAKKEEIRVFGHGPLTGKSRIINSESVDFIVPILPASSFLETRVLFPTTLVSGSSNVQNKEAFAEIMAEEANLKK